MRILFVCLGNICRSPMAEGILRHKATAAGLDWIIDSAATESYHIGEPPHHFSQSTCWAKGIDISAQRARLFMPADLSRYDRIYAMAADVLREMKKIAGPNANYQHVALFLNELIPSSGRSVPDPWYGDEAGYQEVYDLIAQCCEVIITKYAGSIVADHG